MLKDQRVNHVPDALRWPTNLLSFRNIFARLFELDKPISAESVLILMKSKHLSSENKMGSAWHSSAAIVWCTVNGGYTLLLMTRANLNQLSMLNLLIIPVYCL